MSEDKLRAAEQLMKEKRYDAARAVLETMDSEPAREYLRDLQALSPARRPRGMMWITIAASVVCLVIGFALGALTRGLLPTATRASATPAPNAEAVTTAQPLTFTSAELGLNPEIGPIHLARGNYRATLTTDGIAILTLDTETSACGDLIGSGRSLFNILQGQASDGAETLFSARGCDTTLRFNSARSAWTVTIERIGD